MNRQYITDTLSVSGQIMLDDLAVLKEQGVATIINNRPDGEQVDQPTSDALKSAATKMGLSYAYIPITPGQLESGDAERMAAIISASDGKVHAFCRSGNRSTHLWALGQRGQKDSDSLIEIAKEAGYDISGLRPRLQ